MKNRLSALTLCIASFLVAPASADVLIVTTVDTQGNSAAYLEALEPLLVRLGELSPDAETEVFMGAFAGNAVEQVYIVVRLESMAAAGALTESNESDAEYQRLLRRVEATGRTLVARSLLTEVSFD